MVNLMFAQVPDEDSFEENVTLKFRVKDGIHISEFHALCKRFALAVGYTEKTVEDYFGETSYEYCDF